MHPVLEHILSRKGKAIPVNDGRKIALVLFGGIMTGVRGTGACIALEELGLINSFDSVYCFSSGFPNAAYFLAGQSRLSASVYYDDLSGRKFIDFRKFWRVSDVDRLIGLFRDGKKRLVIENIFRSTTHLIAGVRNATTQAIEYVRANELDAERFFNLMRASISMPYLHPGITDVNGVRYKDIGIDTTNQRLRGVLESDSSDILIVYNYAEQNKHTVLQGEKVFEITPPVAWKMSRFETRTEVLKFAAQEMGDLVKRTFGVDTPIQL